ncbi:hypothetical protein C8035_v006079 [Colletotrichum spinosum]|uniref:Non-homologous end-joining factor 1 n=1 Tax=Colletotrichum spinosum TaxID=1347390 RepID=A0A4V3HRU2_9PEZI|nr:hypothetical protein C8035_v006079 [Colletotrichum spinosum]
MANVWSESLDRKAIYRRSLELGTVVDVTENKTNMRTFLEKLKSVFDESHADHRLASMALSMSPGKTAKEESLILDITCDIGWSSPLEWPVYLIKCSPSKLAAELTLPLARAKSIETRRVDSLLQTIQQKDLLLRKLLDKVEASGTLVELFPILAAKQQPSRKAAEARITGLAPFREDAWRSDTEGSDQDIRHFLQHAFGGSGLDYAPLVDPESPDLDRWWTKRGPDAVQILGPEVRQSIEQGSRPRTPPTGNRDNQSGFRSQGDDEDDFQVQSTPPSARKRKEAAMDLDNGTEDEESFIPDSLPIDRLKLPQPKLGIIGGRRPSTPPAAQDKRSGRKLGVIGGKKRGSPSPSPVKRDVRPQDADTTTESEVEDDAQVAEALPAPKPDDDETASESETERSARVNKPISPPTAASRSKIGRIGGIASRSRTPDASTREEAPLKRRLGRIGGEAQPPKSSKGPAAEVAEAAETSREQPESKPVALSKEDTMDRADNRRVELEKDLQRQAAAPKKKKRKF